MALSLASPASVDLIAGQSWTISVNASELPTMVVTKPDGTALDPAVVFEWGETILDSTLYAARYVAVVPALTAGRWLVVVMGPSGQMVAAQAFVSAITANAALPTFADLDSYLGGAGAHSWSDDELTEALDVEAASQRRVCRVPVALPEDLRAALLRRAARYLDMKRRMTQQGSDSNDFEVPSPVPLGRDQEIRRYEAPWRKLVTG